MNTRLPCMNFTKEQIEQIEKLASLYMKISDIALILDIDEATLRAQLEIKDSQAYNAYFKGKALRKLELRKQEMELARVGSPLALDNAAKALIDMEDDE